MADLQELLERSAGKHRHLCPRQVLGVRMGLLAGRLLDIDVPQTDKQLFVFMETDGCGLDGVVAATGCTVGRRTMRVLDFGKVAATFVDTDTLRAVRVYPRPESRTRAYEAISEPRSRWHAQLEAYQTLPDDRLLVAQPVELTVSLAAILSRPGYRVNCEACGEEIMNEREVVLGGQVLCRGCAGQAYYAAERQADPAWQPGEVWARVG